MNFKIGAWLSTAVGVKSFQNWYICNTFLQIGSNNFIDMVLLSNYGSISRAKSSLAFIFSGNVLTSNSNVHTFLNLLFLYIISFYSCNIPFPILFIHFIGPQPLHHITEITYLPLLTSLSTYGTLDLFPISSALYVIKLLETLWGWCFDVVAQMT